MGSRRKILISETSGGIPTGNMKLSMRSPATTTAHEEMKPEDMHKGQEQRLSISGDSIQVQGGAGDESITGSVSHNYYDQLIME